MSIFNYDKDAQGIVTITMDMSGPVNAINNEFNEAMLATLERLENDSGLKGVIFASAKKTFFAGGDLKELARWEKGQEQQLYDASMAVKDMERRIEKLPVPVVAAINGAALGGGMELCLSCNYRIAWNNKAVIVGLPEVTLGLLPGGGGIVRMVNLLGLEKALPYLLEGKKISAVEALEAGIVDQLVDTAEELVPVAKVWIVENAGKEEAAVQPWDRKGHRIPGGDANNPKLAQVLMMAPLMLQQKTRGLLPAPSMILDAAVQATRLDFEGAMRVETRNFVPLVTGAVGKNMISSFFQMNEVKGGNNRPAGFEKSVVKKVGVIGAGMMGQGIAYVSAKAGIEVVLKDVTLEGAQKGKAYSEKLLDKAIARGRSDEAGKAKLLNLITPTDSDSDLDGCDLVIEAVFENMELKHQLIRSTEQVLSENGVWGSNTSTLPITQLASASQRPENFIGIHFFSPVDKMPLVEIICGERTSDETLARTFDYVQQIRKTPIVVNDSPGFYTSRTISTGIMEAAEMIADGVNPIRIESLGKALGWPVGPLALQDEVSQKLLVDIIDAQVARGLLDPDDDPTPKGTAVMRNLVNEDGHGGRYHGGGFYEYRESGKVIWPELVNRYYKADYDIPDQDVKDRLLYRPVIESLKCLEEGVLKSVSDGNIGSMLGIGAPTWTGGYLQFINTYGLEEFITRCNQLADRYGERFRAPAIVKQKLDAGELFV